MKAESEGTGEQQEQANELLDIMQGRPVLINLIPFNPVPELPYETP